MKRYHIILIVITIAVCNSIQAQNRTHIAGFSQYQQYFNPALTGFQGTTVKSYYRDQFAGYDGAPKTTFIAAEVNLEDVVESAAQLKQSFGISALHDTYGALGETQLAATYNMGFRLTDELTLRSGLGFTYDMFRINPDRLVLDQENDPAYMDLMGGNNKLNRYGFNLGVAVTANDYYVGYSLNNIVKEDLSGASNTSVQYPMEHVLMAGYRWEVADAIGLVANGMYRYDNIHKGIAEVQLKGVVDNTVWLGAGYRHGLAYTFNAGVAVKQFRIGYGREISASSVSGFHRGGNEITVSYHFTPVFNKGDKLGIW